MRHEGRWLAVLLALLILAPASSRGAGTASVPNTISAQSGPNLAASLLDANWAALVTYINAREITLGTLGARPTASTSGRLFVATDVNGGTLYEDSGSAWVQIAPGVTSGLAETLTGLTLSNGGTNPSTTLGIAVGAASSDDSAISSRVLISLASAFTKTTAAWTAGTGNGCLDAGAVAASTWYHVFVIYRSDTTATDVLCSTSATAPTMPTPYTNKRRIGSVLTDASKALNFFTQDGDWFRWATTPTSNVPGANPGTAASSIVVNTPLGVTTQANLQIHLHASTASTALELSDLAANDEQASVASPAVAPGFTIGVAGLGGGAPTDVGGRAVERTNTASQVRVRVNASDANVRYEIFTLGYWDRRGRG